MCVLGSVRIRNFSWRAPPRNDLQAALESSEISLTVFTQWTHTTHSLASHLQHKPLRSEYDCNMTNHHHLTLTVNKCSPSFLTRVKF